MHVSVSEPWARVSSLRSYSLWLYVFVFVFLRLFVYFIWMSTLSACMTLLHKRTSDPTTGGFEPSCGYWELNSRPLEEQPVLITAAPSLQATIVYFFTIVFHWELRLTD